MAYWRHFLWSYPVTAFSSRCKTDAGSSFSICKRTQPRVAQVSGTNTWLRVLSVTSGERLVRYNSLFDMAKSWYLVQPCVESSKGCWQFDDWHLLMVRFLTFASKGVFCKFTSDARWGERASVCSALSLKPLSVNDPVPHFHPRGFLLPFPKLVFRKLCHWNLPQFKKKGGK